MYLKIRPPNLMIQNVFFTAHKIFIHLKQQKKKQTLTHLSLASLLWDIGKQNSPICDATERGVPSGAILFAYRIFIEKLNKI